MLALAAASEAEGEDDVEAMAWSVRVQVQRVGGAVPNPVVVDQCPGGRQDPDAPPACHPMTAAAAAADVHVRNLGVWALRDPEGAIRVVGRGANVPDSVVSAALDRDGHVTPGVRVINGRRRERGGVDGSPDHRGEVNVPKGDQPRE